MRPSGRQKAFLVAPGAILSYAGLDTPCTRVHQDRRPLEAMTAAAYAQYKSDNGTTYQKKTLSDLATAVGNVTEALGAHQRKPSAILARYILGKDPATGREHRLWIGDPTNTLWTTATTVTVPDPSNRSTTLTLNIAGRIAEKRYAR